MKGGTDGIEDGLSSAKPSASEGAGNAAIASPSAIA